MRGDELGGQDQAKKAPTLLHGRQAPRPREAFGPQAVEIRSGGEPGGVEGDALVSSLEPPVDEALYHPSHHVVDDQRDFRGLRQSELDLCFRQT